MQHPSEPRRQKSEWGAADFYRVRDLIAGLYRVRPQRGCSRIRNEWEDKSLYEVSF